MDTLNKTLVPYKFQNPTGLLIQLDIGAFTLMSPEKSVEILEPVLEAITRANALYYQTGKFPGLFESGVKYRREEPGFEEWRAVPSLYAHGFGDCDDLACALAGQFRANGYHSAKAIPIIMSDKLVHVLTDVPGVGIYDPSTILGMHK